MSNSFILSKLSSFAKTVLKEIISLSYLEGIHK